MGHGDDGLTAGEDEAPKTWRKVEPPKPGEAGGPPAWRPVQPPTQTPPAAPAPPAPPPPQAPAPVFYQKERSTAKFAWATVGLLVVAGLGYVVWDRVLDGDVTAFHDAPTFVLSSAHEVVSRVIDPGGSDISIAGTGTPLDGVTVNIPGGAVPAGSSVTVGYTEDDAFPADARPVSPQVHVDVPGVGQYDGRVQVSIPVAGATDASRVVAVAYDPASRTWDAAAPIGFDPASGVVTVETAQGTIVGLVEFTGTSFTTTTTFDVDRNGWDISNDAEYLQPGGNAMGMSGWAKWVYQRTGDRLPSAYSPETEVLLADRVQLSQSAHWAALTSRTTLTADVTVGIQIAALMQITQYPQVVILGSSEGAEQAVLATAYDGQAFTVYDPAFPGETRGVPFSMSAGFTGHAGFDRIGYTGLPAMAAEQTQADFHKSARSGTLSSGGLLLTGPAPGASVDGATVTVSGQVSDALVAVAEEAIIYVGSSRFESSLSAGAFALEVPVDQVGAVDIFVIAGPAPAERSMESVAAQTTVQRAAGVAFVVTLTWDQDDTDVDLYVREPNGALVYFSRRNGGLGGQLDVDDTNGFGPEHYTLDPSEGDTLESGTYEIYVHYYSGSVPVSGTVQTVDYTGDRPRVTDTPFQITTANSSSAGTPVNDGSYRAVGSVTF